jgi:hypothetical protein
MRTVTAAFILGLLTTPATPHEGYPMECCHDQDCAPVEKAEIINMPALAGLAGLSTKVPPTRMLVTTKHGTALVPDNLPRRTSPDGRMHACIHGGVVICIFMPPAM